MSFGLKEMTCGATEMLELWCGVSVQCVCARARARARARKRVCVSNTMSPRCSPRPRLPSAPYPTRPLAACSLVHAFDQVVDIILFLLVLGVVPLDAGSWGIQFEGQQDLVSLLEVGPDCVDLVDEVF